MYDTISISINHPNGWVFEEEVQTCFLKEWTEAEIKDYCDDIVDDVYYNAAKEYFDEEIDGSAEDFEDFLSDCSVSYEIFQS